jgi:GNAT superfamily N-acetyltransferase
MDRLDLPKPTRHRIRLALKSELAAIRAIEREAAQRFEGTAEAWIAQDPPAPEALLEARLEAGGLWVACLDGEKPVAALRFHPLEGGLYIEQLDVLPEFAGMRLGAALLDRAEEVARLAGLPALLLSTFRDIPWNAPWYARIGFEVIEVLPPELEALRSEHLARGLDESRRVFMRRSVRGPGTGA